MARLTEIAAFLAPFVVFALYWQLGLRGRVLVGAVLGGVAVLLAALTWLALTSGFSRSGGYVPARLQNGQVISGHGS